MKTGDKVILINNINTLEDHGLFEGVTLYKEYEITGEIGDMFTIVNDQLYYRNFKKFRFITKKEFRKLKLEKLSSL